jgi:hypothetical protein
MCPRNMARIPHDFETIQRFAEIPVQTKIQAANRQQA